MINICTVLTEHYDISDIKHIELIKEDKVHIYKVYGHDENFYFRLYPSDKETSALTIELDYLDYLYKLGFCVEKGLYTKDKRRYIEVDHRLGVLYTQVSGQVDLSPSNLSLSHTIGLIKSIHLESKNFEGFNQVKTFSLDKGLLEFFDQFTSLSTSIKTKYFHIIDLFISLSEDYKQYFDYGLCHGDFHLENILFDEEKPGLIDFDYICRTYQIYDIATLIWTIMPRNEPELVSIKKEQVEFIIGQYLGSCDHFSKKRHLILLMVLMRHIWRQCLRLEYGEFENDDQMIRLFNYQSKIIDDWIEYFDIRLI